jgi:hypothetical protein
MKLAVSAPSSQPGSSSSIRAFSSSNPTPARVVHAAAKRSQQEQQEPVDSSDYLGDFFADSPKWRWPFSGKGQQSGLQGAAKRLYNNKDLRALVEQASMHHNTCLKSGT